MDIFKWPVVIGTFFLGFAFAFMPLEDRPLDKWVGNFIRAIYAPTMFLWKKSEDIPEMLSVVYNPIPVSTSRLTGVGVDLKTVQEYIQSLPQNENSQLDKNERILIGRIRENMKNEFQESYNQTMGAPAIDSNNSIEGLSDRQGVATDTIATLSSINRGSFSIFSPSTNSNKFIPILGKVKIRPLHTKPEKPESKDTDIPQNAAKNETAKTPEQKQPVIDEEKEKVYAKDDIKNEEMYEDLNRESEEPQAVHFTEKPRLQEIPVISQKPEPAEIKSNTKGLQQEIDKLQQDIQTISASTTKADNKELDKVQEQLKLLQQKLTNALSEKQELENELDKAKSQSKKKKNEEVVVPTETMKVEKKEDASVKFVPSQMSAQVGVVQPISPNLVTGIVKNQNGDILPNILIEIKDKNGKTHRALKTNKLGQFYTATRLDNGVYTVYFEDTREIYKFDIIEITLDGNIFPAMEVKAKNPKDVEREKLKEALFGKQD